MEVTIASRRDSSLSYADSKRDQTGVKKNVKFSKNSAKEMMTITKAELVRITGKPNLEEKRSIPFEDTMWRHPTLQELQEKKYSFPDSDLPRMLDDLLRKGSFNFQSQKGLKRWEGLLTSNATITIKWYHPLESTS